MEILPDLRLVVEGVHISLRQIQVLVAIAETNSQNQAARALEISVPVLHRYIKELERKLDKVLISTTPRGTILTDHGKEILEAHKRFENRLKARQNPAIACSPLFSDLVLKAISLLEREGHQIDMLIGDDELNYYYMEMGLVDVVLFDDPIYIHKEKKDKELEIVEVVKDSLIHVRRGKRYLRYKYGAQRIGFSNLDLQGIDYETVGETRNLQELLTSRHSFFINRSLALREELDLKSHTEPKLLMHSIFAVRSGKGEELDILMNRLEQMHKKS
jgi:molybdate transport repressor ModE-like protein